MPVGQTRVGMPVSGVGLYATPKEGHYPAILQHGGSYYVSAVTEYPSPGGKGFNCPIAAICGMIGEDVSLTALVRFFRSNQLNFEAMVKEQPTSSLKCLQRLSNEALDQSDKDAREALAEGCRWLVRQLSLSNSPIEMIKLHLEDVATKLDAKDE